ncbi:hypothetical protein ACE40W_07085 [Enterococcus avium]|uniref:hypothetical protein n=1 Tax=Enterococcus avium TaxID=33945 RepID=UPI0035C95C47
MTELLAQHGPAKGQKITDSLLDGNLNGAIFSPNDEKIDSIIAYVEKTNELNFENTFLDPQFYFSTFEPTILKKLSDISVYPSNIARRDWRKKSSKILDYIDLHAGNTQILSNTLITPGFYIDNIDWHFDYSIEMYNYCVEEYEFNRYALSLLINTSFFSNKANVEELIDELEDNIEQKEYIYMTFCHDNNTETNYEEMDSSCLGNILYTLYRIKKMGFKIILGYTFMNSVLFSILDCEFVASGWFNTLRKFQKNRFDLSDTFGRRKKRYTSTPLLSYVMFEDLKTMLNTKVIGYEDILSGTKYDDRFQQNPDSLSFVDLEHQYWESISLILGEIEKAGDISNRINFMREVINKAIELYKKVISLLEQDGEKEAATRIKSTSKHLVTWLDAIDVFKSNALIV